jgi:hypothetical protein
MGMDSEVSFYMERFKREEVNLSEAQRNRIEWVEKERRYQDNMRALLLLLTNRAQEVKQPLPKDILETAANMFGTQIHDAFKGLAVAAPEVPGNEEKGPTERPNGDGSDRLAVPPLNNGVREPSRIDWIAEAVATSGSAGITPPEIMRKSAKAGIKMHQNYPYVALRKLVERKQVEKKGARYYKAK